MSLNMRLSADDHRHYNPGRDLAWCFGDILEAVFQRLEHGSWKELEALLQREGVDFEQVDRAGMALQAFCLQATTKPRQTMLDCLEEAGWSQVHPTAQLALLAMISTVVMGYYWKGVREVTLGGQGPIDSFHGLRETGLRMARLLAAPPWWRRTRRWLQRLRNRLLLRVS